MWRRASAAASGERYILGAENLTLATDLCDAGEDRQGGRRRKCGFRMRWRMPPASVSTAWAGVTGKEPLAPLDGVQMARKKMWVRHDKAAAGIGLCAGFGGGGAGARCGVVSSERILLSGRRG